MIERCSVVLKSGDDDFLNTHYGLKTRNHSTSHKMRCRLNKERYQQHRTFFNRYYVTAVETSEKGCLIKSDWVEMSS